ncbi:MAG: hypothetical protein HYR88_12720 [Verrucomicrobia bacterium]|nr:hypothetical protein [Verrucomicrobiota bacterium]
MPAPPNNNPDVAYFHQELSPYGRWILGEDGLLYWQPTVAVSAPGWRPYVDRGHWMWTDHGWYWVSDYPWGWAAFHYGRWHLHPHHGWIWLPDRLWGPAWVVWRSGGDHCGWAPLPPGAVYDTAGGYFVFRGRRVEAGFDFGLGASHFTFRLVREFGEPMRWRPRNEVEIREVFSRTTVVHSYSVTRTGSGAESRVAVFNRGIEPAAGVGGRGHGLAPVHIQDLETPAPGRAHEHLDAHGRTLQVYRPRFGAHR